MIVRVAEVGHRPALLTKARRFAPAGARAFGQYLETQPWADTALLVLDWSNELKKMAPEVAKPVLFVQVTKKLPEYEDRNLLSVDIRLDVDEIFGGDEMTAEAILDLSKELEETVNEKIARRRAT